VEDEHSLAWLSQLQGQSGVISRQQATDAGITAKTIEWRLRSGAWRRVHPGVYATFTGELPRKAKLWAAVLQAGAGAALSHESAAEIHELIDKPSTWIHVSVPAGRHPGQETKIRGVIIHRSRKLVPEWQPPWQLPRTSVEDTVLDLAAAARTFDDAYGWISAAAGPRPIGSATRSPCARECAGGPGLLLPSPMLPTGSTHHWNGTTFTAWNAPMACPRRDGRPSAGTAAVTGT
jgi:predicted transcriptional regulator of viral defense system